MFHFVASSVISRQSHISVTHISETEILLLSRYIAALQPTRELLLFCKVV